ncbi:MULTISPECIES: hypothetical protein [unclassified Campylobacter]|uniref:hypothetical protein n=1 Tax=unclassified Campylobacter TaxID=2593542 RepID=UPI001D653065|nr:hypothetical protein [Campylobacter sp. RM12651]MBZ7990359.1 hypothetical protein [Campylobacter sp. RM9331]MBZ7993356.1 hypothetical protein [Campylobacter sp. RM9333]MBZ8006409.1 hypothetical protein [Campylobacter sp. RM9332]ULO02788.1 hypothetical protein AVBRAN_0313 [Campylobacter sp. RM12651]
MKIDISQVKNIAMSWADNVKTKELNTKDISNLKDNINKNNFEIKTNKEQDYNVFFKFDESNIGVKLSDKNINRLKEFFNEDNFIDTSKGIILDKDAASFVAGWFSDVAYKSNFLAADRNNDGEVDKKEIDYTIYAFALYIEPTKDGSGQATKVASYVPSILTVDNKQSTDISTILDGNISMDKNLDGYITIAEKYNYSDTAYQYGVFLDNLPFMTISHKKINTNITEELNKKTEEQIKLNNIIEKLKKSQSLDNNEKEILQKFNIQNISNELKISEDKLKDLISSDKLGDFIDFTKEFKKDLSDTRLIDIRI